MHSDTNLDQLNWVGVELPFVGIIPAYRRRTFSVGGRLRTGFSLHIQSGPTRDRLIQRLFSTGQQNELPPADETNTFITMLTRVFGRSAKVFKAPKVAPPPPPPDWLIKRIGTFTAPDAPDGPPNEGLRRHTLAI